MTASLEPFAGLETLAATPPRVFAALTDLEALARAMPGLVSCERGEGAVPPQVKAVVRPGLSFLSANLRLGITLAQAVAPKSATIHVAAQSIGVSMRIEANIRIEPKGENAALVSWEARVDQMSGLITAVGPSLIRAAADKVIRDGWDAIRRSLSA
jgi:carbon monoxide dehydrogenase subunit G